MRVHEIFIFIYLRVCEVDLEIERDPDSKKFENHCSYQLNSGKERKINKVLLN